MKRKYLFLLALIFTIGSCAPVIYGPQPGPGRPYPSGRPPQANQQAFGYVVLVKDNPRFDKVTVVINDRSRYNINHDYRRYNFRVREIKLRTGRHDIKIYHRGRLINQRRINITPGRTIRISL